MFCRQTCGRLRPSYGGNVLYARIKKIGACTIFFFRCWCVSLAACGHHMEVLEYTRKKKKNNFSRDCFFSCVIFFLVVVALGLRFCAFLQKPRKPHCKPRHRKLVATNSTNWVRWVCAFARFCRNHENQNANPDTESLSPPIVLIACVGFAFLHVFSETTKTKMPTQAQKACRHQ